MLPDRTFVVLLLMMFWSSSVDCQPTGNIHLVPTNVSATCLSGTSALVTWSMVPGPDSNASDERPAAAAGLPQRVEITYRPVQDRQVQTRRNPSGLNFYIPSGRQRIIVPVPVELTSYILRDLR